MLAWGFGFWMWRLTLAHGVLFLMSAEYSVLMCGAWPGTLVTWPWIRVSMIYCYALRLWSHAICYTCRSYWFMDSVGLSCSGGRCLCKMAAYVWDGYGAFRQPTFECGCCEMLVFRVCGVRQNIYVFCLYSNPDLHRWPDFWLFTSINGCHAGWGCPCLFPVCRWFEWSSSGVARFYHHEPSWSCSIWLCNCLRLRSAGCRPNPCTWWNTWPPDDWCSTPSTGCFAAPIGNSDHCCLPAVISMAQAVPNLGVSRKVFLKHQVNWNTVCGAIHNNIWLADNPVEVWTNICPCWLDVIYQPRSSVWVTRIRLGFMINAGMLLASSLGLSFSGPVIALGLTGKSLSAVKRELIKPTRTQNVSDRNMDVLMNV